MNVETNSPTELAVDKIKNILKGKLSLAPNIGIARVGNSQKFYIEPEEIGGRPFEWDENKSKVTEKHVEKYKDKSGKMKRQASRFRVFYGNREICIGSKIDLDSDLSKTMIDKIEIKTINWKVRLANKKSVWWSFESFYGNLLIGKDRKNSYEECQKKGLIKKRNTEVADDSEDRKKYILDSGEQTISGINQIPVELSVQLPTQSDDSTLQYNKDTLQYNKDKLRFSKYIYGVDPTECMVTSSFQPEYKGVTPKRQPEDLDKINTLGQLRTDENGNLLVLGGYGKTWGSKSLESFGGADGWFDDISDGYVKCGIVITVYYESEKKHKDIELDDLDAWCIVAPPKLAPELINIVTLDDVMYDVAVRNFNANTKMCCDGVYKEGYEPDYDTEIAPILNRPAGYRWVAAIPVMSSFSPPPFNPRDKTPENKENREAYYNFFRHPGSDNDSGAFVGGDQNKLTINANKDKENKDEKLYLDMPLMPMQPNSNPIRPNLTHQNSSGQEEIDVELISKFLTLTQTQDFILKQWSKGCFKTTTENSEEKARKLTRASVGNCVGSPLCPGIEVTWNMYNPYIYAYDKNGNNYNENNPYKIQLREKMNPEKGQLDPNRDEADQENQDKGCEPGDLTKRMAIPWHADAFACLVQYVNFTDPRVNKEGGLPKPPTYYTYWWPPQVPVNVITGDVITGDVKNKENGQTMAGTPAGFPVNHNRGINSYMDMIKAWHRLGFITNQTQGDKRDLFPYFVERERDHSAFKAVSTAVSSADSVVAGADSGRNFFNAWYLDPEVSKSAGYLCDPEVRDRGY